MHRRRLLCTLAGISTALPGCTAVSTPSSVGNPARAAAAEVDVPERNVDVRDRDVIDLLPTCPDGGYGMHRRRERTIDETLAEPGEAYEWVVEQANARIGEPTLLLGVEAIVWRGETRQLPADSHLIRTPRNRTYLVLPRADGTEIVEYWAGWC